MNAFGKCNAALHVIMLALWLSALLAAGVAAMNVFGTLDLENTLGVSVERYESIPPDEHARLAASHVMEGVFFTVDLIQFIAAPLATLTLVLHLALARRRWKRPANLTRLICVLIAAALFAWHAVTLRPTMNVELRERWAAAEAGELEQAEALRASFNARHETADLIYRVELLLILIALGATGAALITPRPNGSTPPLETPSLAQR